MEHWQNLSLKNLTEEFEGVLYKEKWKSIDGYDGLYKVSSFGRIKFIGDTNHPKKIKSQRAPKNGYLLVSLWKNNKEKKALVHRLVAKAFIQNPNNKKTVNHIKGVRSDNRFFRLEWNTQGENAKHSFRELGRKSYTTGRFGKDSHVARPVRKIDRNGIELQCFESVTAAALSVNATTNCISRVCKGKQKTSKGFKWEYA